MVSADRATRLGLTIVIVALVAIVLAGAGIFALIRFSSQLPSYSYDPVKVVATGVEANGEVLVSHAFRRKFFASAVLDLPPVPPQDDSPSLQITFYQQDAMIQGGVIRTPENHFRLKGFIAYSQAGAGALEVRYFGTLSDRPHAVALSGDTHEIAFSIDGKILSRLPRSKFLPLRRVETPWLMLGTAVGKPGNAASGTISRIFVQGENDAAPQAVVPKCVVTRGGLEMRRDGETWVLSGRYVPGVPARYLHCTPAPAP